MELPVGSVIPNTHDSGFCTKSSTIWIRPSSHSCSVAVCSSAPNVSG